MQGVSARQRACIEEERGLSELVFLCIGMPLDKTYQLSDWERRPLSEEQLLYAGSLIFVEVLFHLEKLFRKSKEVCYVKSSIVPCFSKLGR